MHKVLARLLAIAHHIEARVFLRLDPKQGGVGFGLLQAIALRHPFGPKLVGLGQPFGFRQTACNCGFKHAYAPENVEGFKLNSWANSA